MIFLSVISKSVVRPRLNHVLASSFLLCGGSLTAVFYAVPFLCREGYMNGYLAYFADDFFYYLVIARNTVNGAFSSFDTIHYTNGYHPLWQAFLTLLYAAVPSEAFLIGTLLVVLFTLNLAATWLCWRLLGVAGVSPLARLIGTLVFHVSCLALFRMGMEVALAVPLCLLTMLLTRSVLIRPKSLHWALLGFSHALMILARLDTVLLSVLLLLLTAIELLRARMGAGVLLRGAALFAIGFLPLIGYLLANLVYFGAALPLSGQAKQLKDGLFFSTKSLIYLIPTLKKPLFPTIAIIVETVGFLTMLISWRCKSPFVRIVFGAALLFPMLFFTVTSLASDWSLWYWYFYPLALVLPFGTTLIIDFALERTLLRLLMGAPLRAIIVTTAVVFALGVWRISLLYPSPSRNSIFIAANRLAEFGHAHTGYYAMGDRAGLTAWLLGRPVIQMEGLVADRYMLQAIARQADLIEVLWHYQVDYYIATQGDWERGCYLTSEPKLPQSGPNSPRMIGRFCDQPVFSVDDGQPPGPRKVSSFVFAVRR